MTVPVLWTPRRMLQLAGVALIGALQALAALGAALAGSRLLAAPEGASIWLLQAVVGATAVLIVARVLQRRFAESFALTYIAELRSAFMSHVIRIPIGAREMRTGLVMTRVVNDLSAIKLWLADGVVAIVVGIGMLATVAGLAAWFQPVLLAPLAAAVALWAVPVGLSLRPLERKVRESRRHRGRIAARAGQLLGARLTLLGLGRHGAAVRGLLRRSGKLNSALVSRATLSGVLRSSGELVFPSVALMVAGAAYLTNSGKIDAVMLGVLVMMTGIIAAHLGAVALGLEYRIAYRVSFARLQSILKTPAIDLNQGRKIGRRPLGGVALRVEALEVAPTQRPLSFSVKRGEAAVLTGLAEGEAADLVVQLAGLKAEMGGKVRFDDDQAHEIRPRDWWRTVVVVSASLPLMAASVEANAAMGAHSSVSAEERARVFAAFGLSADDLAVRVTAAHPLPVRLAVAVRAVRAVLRRSPLVLVDDPDLLESEALFEVLGRELKTLNTTLVVVGTPAKSSVGSLRKIDLGA